jgi:hypothetical protein
VNNPVLVGVEDFVGVVHVPVEALPHWRVEPHAQDE